MRTVTSLDELRKRSKQPGKPKRRRWLGLLLFVLLLGGVLWAAIPESHMSRVQQLQTELAKGNTLSPEERKAKFTELRAEMKQLTDDQKWELAAPMREKQRAGMDRYFALAPVERIKYLDQKIDSSEKMRKDWGKKAGGNQNKAGGAAGMPPGGGSRPGGTKKSNEEIEKARKARLDRTSPEDRARNDQFRKEMNDRRRQRGLPVRAS
jgi:hypothetical protein